MSDKKNDLVKHEEVEHQYDAGLAKVSADKFADPGIEPHRVRMTDKSEKHEKTAARQVAGLFLAAIISVRYHLELWKLHPLERAFEDSPVLQCRFGSLDIFDSTSSTGAGASV